MAAYERIDIARSAFDFVDAVQHLTTTSSIVERFTEQLGQFGFSAFLITGLPNPKANLQDHVILSGWPHEWFELYMERQLYDADPMAEFSRSTVEPFIWSDVTRTKGELPDPARQVMSLAQDFGLIDGFSVPVFGADGYQACVTMGGEKLELEGNVIPAIQLMSMYAHNRARQLTQCCQKKLDVALLTSREQEVLTWVAAGKSSWEIGKILGISERTVNGTIGRACNKLDACNRTHAVAVALTAGEIEF